MIINQKMWCVFVWKCEYIYLIFAGHLYKKEDNKMETF